MAANKHETKWEQTVFQCLKIRPRDHTFTSGHWYVSNVSIISDVPCSYYTKCYMFYLHFIAFIAFSWTNLLTRCHSASCLFSAVFGFRKVTQEIFSELDETKSQVHISPDTTGSPNESRRRATEPPHHVVAWVPSLACRHVVWEPRGSPPSPLWTPCTWR